MFLDSIVVFLVYLECKKYIAEILSYKFEIVFYFTKWQTLSQVPRTLAQDSLFVLLVHGNVHGPETGSNNRKYSTSMVPLGGSANTMGPLIGLRNLKTTNLLSRCSL